MHKICLIISLNIEYYYQRLFSISQGINMKKETADALEQAACQLDINILNEPNYSGRGMFGNTTCAIVVDNSPIICSLIAYASRHIVSSDYFDSFLEDMQKMKSDELGNDIVFY